MFIVPRKLVLIVLIGLYLLKFGVCVRFFGGRACVCVFGRARRGARARGELSVRSECVRMASKSESPI